MTICQRDLIVDLLLRIEDEDMGVMNIVTMGLVTCVKRQLGCISFFENTKIIKKIELLLSSRNRFTAFARPCPCHSFISRPPSPKHHPFAHAVATRSIARGFHRCLQKRRKNPVSEGSHSGPAQRRRVGAHGHLRAVQDYGRRVTPIALICICRSPCRRHRHPYCIVIIGSMLAIHLINCTLQLHRPRPVQRCL